MGQDIHNKILIYSNIEHKYIDGMSLTTYPEYSCFRPVFDGRNYDFFSLFGSTRGNLRELSYGSYGIPDFLPETYKEFLKEDRDLYGHVWWKFPKFERAIQEYIEMLRDPMKYYEDDEYYLEAIKNREFDLKNYDQDMHCIYIWLKDILKQLDTIKSDCKNGGLEKYIDPRRTVFLFYFDS